MSAPLSTRPPLKRWSTLIFPIAVPGILGVTHLRPFTLVVENEFL